MDTICPQTWPGLWHSNWPNVHFQPFLPYEHLNNQTGSGISAEEVHKHGVEAIRNWDIALQKENEKSRMWGYKTPVPIKGTIQVVPKWTFCDRMISFPSLVHIT